MIFAEPPSTRYDLRFSIAGIPVRVHPVFWLMGFLLGAYYGDLVFMVIWILVVFVSVLIHELGHAIAFRVFARPSRIVLYAFGGLTIPEASPWIGRWATVSLGPNQEMIISLAGPGAGFLFVALVMAAVVLAGGAIYLTPLPELVLPTGGRILDQFLNTLLWVNIFWGSINLLPVYPLDGGSVARHILIKADPLNGFRKSLWLSVIVGAVAAVAGLVLFRSIFMALLFGLLAFQSYQQLQGRPL